MVDEYLFTFEFLPDCHKTQEMCKKAISKDSDMLKYCIDRYITQEMCKKAFSKDPFALK